MCSMHTVDAKKALAHSFSSSKDKRTLGGLFNVREFFIEGNKVRFLRLDLLFKEVKDGEIAMLALGFSKLSVEN